MSQDATARARRAAWHEARIRDADSPRAALRAACDWLMSEAGHGGPDHIADATRVVLAEVAAIRDAAAASDTPPAPARTGLDALRNKTKRWASGWGTR